MGNLTPFLECISRNSKFIDWRRERFYRIIPQQGFLRRDAYIKIHIGKFDYNVLNEIAQIGLAKRLDWDWYKVEVNTAHELMTRL